MKLENDLMLCAVYERNKELLEENRAMREYIKELNKRIKENNEERLEELRDDITDDTRYILDKMEKINDPRKLKGVLEALERITAEI